jgi:hypothetical protein
MVVELIRANDADKKLDLGSDLGNLIARTFTALDPAQLSLALDLLYDAIIARLAGSDAGQHGCQRQLQAVVLADIRRLLGGSVTRGV